MNLYQSSVASSLNTLAHLNNTPRPDLPLRSDTEPNSVCSYGFMHKGEGADCLVRCPSGEACLVEECCLSDPALKSTSACKSLKKQILLLKYGKINSHTLSVKIKFICSLTKQVRNTLLFLKLYK